ncbi:hypothetical protein R6Q59_022161 [Mikania micrantha]
MIHQVCLLHLSARVCFTYSSALFFYGYNIKDGLMVVSGFIVDSRRSDFEDCREYCYSLFSSGVEFKSTLPLKNAGLFGAGNDPVSLRSMEINFEVVGLSIALSCTHRSAT